MSVPYPPLNKAQKNFILRNIHKKMTWRAMSKKIKTSEAKVREFILANNLPHRKNGQKRKRSGNMADGLFDYDSFFKLYRS